MMEPVTELAKLFKERDRQKIPSITTGIVESPLYMNPVPKILVRLNDRVVLDETHIIVSQHIYSHYEYYDELRKEYYWLEKDDEVILVPVMNEQLYFMIDRARRLV